MKNITPPILFDGGNVVNGLQNSSSIPNIRDNRIPIKLVDKRVSIDEHKKSKSKKLMKEITKVIHIIMDNIHPTHFESV
jgi:hypothetical protein